MRFDLPDEPSFTLSDGTPVRSVSTECPKCGDFALTIAIDYKTGKRKSDPVQINWYTYYHAGKRECHVSVS